MTILTPLLFILLMIVPVWLSQKNLQETKKIGIIDQSGDFKNLFVSNDKLKFNYLSVPADSLKNTYNKNNLSSIVLIPENYKKDSIYIYSNEPITIDVKQTIKLYVNNFVKNKNLLEMNIDPTVLAEAEEDIPLKTWQWSKTGELKQSSSELNTALGFIGAFIIYMVIFIYGAQLMRGTMEEKKDRIVEIIVSSAKPFELMLGKILGVAMVAFTQFGIWLSAITGFIIIGKETILSKAGPQFSSILIALQNLDSLSWILLFLFFFVGGYLLYGSLFAAIGGAVDNETDTQQFMLPITIPLIIAFVFAQTIIQAPNGDLAVTLSIIPFTSPVVMMVRIGFGVPLWQMFLSAGLLIVTFLFTTYIAGRIYRIGILSYGKKVTYKDLWRWIKYKG